MGEKMLRFTLILSLSAGSLIAQAQNLDHGGGLEARPNTGHSGGGVRGEGDRDGTARVMACVTTPEGKEDVPENAYIEVFSAQKRIKGEFRNENRVTII